MSGKPLTGRTFLYWIGGFFLIVFISIGSMMYIAVNSMSGLETEEPYEKGVAYNKTIAKARQQEAARLSVSIAADPQPDKLVRLSVRVRAADDAPYMEKDVRVLFFRPTKQGYDKTIRLKEKKPGLYRGNIMLPLRGIWDLKLEIKDAGKIVYKSKSRVILQ
jgi:nitrogen fixation protein FixH